YGWDLETNLGLRWLRSQLDALLDKWRVEDWESRLVMSPLEPEFRATVSRGELRALGRAIESIERGLRRGGEAPPGEAPGRDLSALPPPSPTAGSEPQDTPPAPDGQPSAVPADPTGEAGSAQKRARIVAAYYESQGAATNAEIAKEVGAN